MVDAGARWRLHVTCGGQARCDWHRLAHPAGRSSPCGSERHPAIDERCPNTQPAGIHRPLAAGAAGGGGGGPAWTRAVATLTASALWLLWPLPLAFRMPSLVLLCASLAWGNAATLLAVALALAPRYPILWAVLVWTKVTPAVGILALWRRHAWRALAVALGASVLIGVAVLGVAPGLMSAWFTQLGTHPAVPRFLLPALNVPLGLRAAVALAIAWGGSSRPWTLAIAAAVATPDLSLATFGILAALPRLWQTPAAGARRGTPAMWRRGAREPGRTSGQPPAAASGSAPDEAPGPVVQRG